jgi:hypothetical protein
MHALFCVDFDGFVHIETFACLTARAEFSDSLDRTVYRHIIEVDGPYNFVE